MMSRFPARVTVEPTDSVSPGRTSRRPVGLMVRLVVVEGVPCGARVPVVGGDGTGE